MESTAITRFNPQGVQRSHDDWVSLVEEQQTRGDGQWSIAIGFATGAAIWGLTANPIAAIAVFTGIAGRGFSQIKQTNRAAKVARENGAIAPLLEGDDFKDYLLQAGPKETYTQIAWAMWKDIPVSDAAEDWFESVNRSKNKALPVTTTALPIVEAFDRYHEQQQTATADVAALPTTSQFSGSAVEVPTVVAHPASTVTGMPILDIADKLAARFRPTIITARPRTGKGVIMSHASKLMQERYEAEIWMINPKPRYEESGYWAHVDHLWEVEVDKLPIDHEPTAQSLEEFIMSWRRSDKRPKVLIFDEQILIEAQLPKWYKRFVPALLKAEASSGESDRRILYAITQSPLSSDMGLSGGNRSTFDYLTLANEEGLPFLESAKKSGFVPFVPDVVDLRAAPRGTLCNYNHLGDRWVAVPVYDVPQPIQLTTRDFHNATGTLPTTSTSTTTSSTSEAVGSGWKFGGVAISETSLPTSTSTSTTAGSAVSRPSSFVGSGSDSVSDLVVEATDIATGALRLSDEQVNELAKGNIKIGKSTYQLVAGWIREGRSKTAIVQDGLGLKGRKFAIGQAIYEQAKNRLEGTVNILGEMRAWVQAENPSVDQVVARWEEKTGVPVESQDHRDRLMRILKSGTNGIPDTASSQTGYKSETE